MEHGTHASFISAVPEETARECATRRPLLFLSHAGVDTTEALALAERIEASPEAQACGLRVWVDQRDLRVGASWMEQLEQVIVSGSTAFALYLSSAGARYWVRMEIELALDRVISEERSAETERHGRPGYPFIPLFKDETARNSSPKFATLYHGVFLDQADALQKLVSAATQQRTQKKYKAIDEPFLGLKAFESEDAYLFFGRSDETRQLLERLKTTGFVIVVGDSGSGKSSLVRAGVVPAFREGRLNNPLEPRPAAGAWQAIVMQPSVNPAESLIGQALEAARGDKSIQAHVDVVSPRLRDGKAGALADLLRVCLPNKQHPEEQMQILLVIDQFEELWTQTTENLRKKFLDDLVYTVENSGLRIRVVATMRRDYFFQTSSHENLKSLLDTQGEAGRFNLHRMKHDALRACIENRLAFTDISTAEAKALADEIIRDAGDNPGELALVEVALFSTWRKRKKYSSLLDAYKAIGRIEGALPNAADEAMKNLGERDVDAAETLFIRLVTQSPDGGVTRRRAFRGEFAPGVWQLAQKLATKEFGRLVVIGEGERGWSKSRVEPTSSADGIEPDSAPSDKSDGLETLGDGLAVELAHEQVATQWPRYQQWLRGSSERADDKCALDRLIDRANEWVSHGRNRRDAAATSSELDSFNRLDRKHRAWLAKYELDYIQLCRRHQKIQRLWKSALIIFPVIFLALIWWALYNTDKAKLSSFESDANALWGRLGLQGSLGSDEAAAVRELMALKQAKKEVFFDLLFKNPALAPRFNREPRMISWALINGSESLRSRLLEKIIKREKSSLGLRQIVALILFELELGNLVDIDEFSLVLLKEENINESLSAIESLVESLSMLNAEQIDRISEWAFVILSGAGNTQAQLRIARLMIDFASELDATDARKTSQRVQVALSEIEDRTVQIELLKVLAALAPQLDPIETGKAWELVRVAWGKSDDQTVQSRLGEVLTALAPQLDPTETEKAFMQTLGALGETGNWLVQSQLHVVVAALAPQLDPTEAGKAFEQARVAWGKTKDQSIQSSLRDVLTALAPRLDPTEAGKALDLVRVAWDKTEDQSAQSGLGEVLTALAPQLDPTEAGKALELVRVAWGKTKDQSIQSSLRDVLTALAPRLDPTEARKALELVRVAWDKTEDQSAQSGLGEVLTALAPQLDPTEAGKALELVRVAWGKTEDKADQRQLRQALAALALRLHPTEAGKAFQQALVAWGNTKDHSIQSGLGEVLTALAPRLDPIEAGKAFEQALVAWGKTEDQTVQRRLGKVLEALAPQLESTEAGKAFELVHVAWGKIEDQTVQRRLGEVLAALAPQLESTEAGKAFELVHVAWGKIEDWLVQSQLYTVVAALAPQLDPTEAGNAFMQTFGTLGETEDVLVQLELHMVVPALAPRLDPTEAGKAFEQVRVAWGKTKDHSIQSTLLVVLTALAPRLDPTEARKALELVRVAWGKTEDQTVQRRLGEVLAAFAPQLNPIETEKALELVRVAWGKAEDQTVQRWLGEVLTALAPQLDPIGTGKAWELVRVAWGKSDDQTVQRWLGEVLTALAPQMEPTEAGKAFELVRVAWDKTEDQAAQRQLGEVLAALARQLDTTGAVKAAEQVYAALGQPPYSAFQTQLPEILKTLISRLDMKSIQGLFERAMKTAEIADSYSEKQIKSILEAIEPKVKKNIAEDFLKRLLKFAICRPDSADHISKLSVELFAGKLDLERATMYSRLAILNPFLSTETANWLVDRVRDHPPAGLSESSGVWDIVAWNNTVSPVIENTGCR